MQNQPMPNGVPLGKSDIKQILEWNKNVPRPFHTLLHVLFQEKAAESPEALAVHGWDGKFTYAELHEASNALANRLVEAGIAEETKIPVCFEKSVWAIVAFLGILKAGCAFVPLDLSQPPLRRSKIISQCHAKVSVTSAACSNLFSDGVRPLIVDRSILKDESSASISRPVNPGSPAYVMFTSGSTGMPKGAVISHRAICTSLKHRARLGGFTAQSRVLQFAAPVFDALLDEAFMTLSVGGCICVPSDKDKLDGLSQSIVDLEVNTLVLTPTVGRLLDPKGLPGLQNVTLAGETVSEYDIARWGPSRKVVVGYGPTECSVMCVYHTVDFQNLPSIGTIGNPITCVGWIVDPDDHNKLVPIGAVGELLIEGHVLADGYLNDPQRTNESFVESPDWLVHKLGRSGKLYKTGDLVKYNHDGGFSFVARKDTQVKIHGQRVELGEVESFIANHLMEAGTVVVDTVTLSDSNTVLAAFIQITSLPTVTVSEGTNETYSLQVLMDTAGLVDKLSQSIPEYMIPSVFFVPKDLPITISGKADRRLLRQSASMLTLSRINQVSKSTAKMGPINSKEHTLRQIWARVLKLEPSNIGVDDSFFRLGGDSITAVMVTNQARKKGIHITVADILRHPKLGDSAVAASKRYRAQEPGIQPFSLVKASVDVPKLRDEISHELNIEINAIEDILPCTPLQEGLLSLTNRYAGDYMFQFTLHISDQIDIYRLRRAWEEVVTLLPILRTRMVSTKENGIHQVVLRDAVHWEESHDLQGYLQRDKNEPMGLGDPLTRYAIIHPTSENLSLVWTIHHSLYDGWSVQRMLAMVERAYRGLVRLSQLKDYSTFIKYLQDHNDNKAKEFWKSYLANCEAAQFPTVHLSKGENNKNKAWKRDLIEDERPVMFPEGSNYLPTTLIRGALSILISQLTTSDEVVFGTTVFGRHYPIDDMEDIVGPTIATVPIRANLSEAEAPTISSLLDSLQEKATSMIPYEQYGLQNIMQLNRDCQAACNFQTHLTVQPEDYESLNTPTLGNWEKPKSLLTSLNTYPLMIECFFSSTSIRMQVNYELEVLSTVEVERIVEQFYHALRRLLQADFQAKLGDIRIDPLSNIQQIWRWNRTVPEPVDELLHGLFTETVKRVSNSSLAVRGWDKDFTYMELDKASTNLACHLANLGVAPGEAVLLCFEKSAWAIMAMLGILKTGAKFVPLDPSQPVYRREKVIRQSSGRVIITSATHSRDFKQNETVVVLDQSILQGEQDACVLPGRVSTDDSAYIMFTSGTTGEPKGVVVRHQAICTSIKLRAVRQGFGPDSRVLQFSSYTFDTMIDEIFMTLHVGGCICVLSDSDRLNNLSSAIVNLRANTIGLTPAVARLLNPQEVPEVDSIILWGEAVLYHDVARWTHLSRLMIGYGPTECCVLSAHHRVTDVDEFLSGSIIGKAAASVCWVVDPSEHSRLAPLGGIGELLVEGPALSDGYLKDTKATAASFVEDPDWLLRGAKEAAGRHGRLYKTGDLVKYTGDGNLCYIGRKDTQIKIHGQRVELGEVEHCVGLCIPEATEVVAEVLKLGGNTALVVVVQTEHNSTTALNGKEDVPHLEPFQTIMETEEKLSHYLPRYMVPSAFFVINDVPKMASGKVNRKLIRALISEFELRRQASTQDIRIHPIGSVERKLHQIWAEILRLEPEVIDISSNFFQLGGNSIKAMKISNHARKQGIAITVADMFRYPKLVDSAAAVGNRTIAQTAKVPPFSLLDISKSSTLETLRDEVARAYHLDQAAIEDLLPCTPLQEGLLSLTNRDHGDYVVQFVLHISESIRIEKLRMAWNRVIKMLPILRTRIVSVSTGQSKLYQAVIQEEASWTETSDLQAYLEHDKSLPMRLGDPLARYAIAHDSAHNKRYLVLTLHHSLYDGWSAQRMLAMVERAYQGVSPGQPQDFRIFIKYLKENNNEQAERFWKSHLVGCQAPQFPTVHLPKDAARKRDLFEDQRPITFRQRRSHLPSTFIRGAMSILISRLTVSNKVIFGGTIFGRHYAIDGIEDIIGPTIATVPIRVTVEEKQTVFNVLNSLQEHATEMIPYEQFGIQNIKRLSQDFHTACNFQTHLTIQPEEYQSLNTESLGTWHRPSGLLASLNTYPLMIECFLDSAGLKTQVNFNTTVLSALEVKRIVDQFYHTIEQLMQADESTLISEIQIDPPSNIKQIWTWNRTVPEQVNELLHTLFERKAAERPDALAIRSWDGDFTYHQLDEVSTQLSRKLNDAGVKCGTAVPMCVEKSIWAIVAMLGILKAGGAFVPIDPIQPAPRRQKIIEETGAQIVVTSDPCSSLVKSSGNRHLIIAGSYFLANAFVEDRPCSSIPPKSPAYIIFTSGSTGEPKGVVVEHKAVCTSISHRMQDRAYGPETRTLQFASYTFDAMIDEIFMTLHAGGCVCIPSEEDRANPSKAIVDLEANTLCLTPTVSRLIAPNDVPSIKSIILWGEPVFSHDIAQWKHVPTVMVGYGPTECCVACAHYVVDPQNVPPESLIGRATASTAWIVDHDDHGKLAPIGAIGELMIEGHTLARGYLNDAQKTSDSFIEDPEWLLRGADDDLPGRHGRLYKTGDLVRYNVDSSITYIRRKDTQVKINGQRVELGEVESHMARHMLDADRVVADVVTFSDDRIALVAFIKMKQKNRIAEHILTKKKVTLWHIKPSTDLTKRLFEHLPRHMVPSVLLAVGHIPETISGKVDRKLLREVAGGLNLSSINQTSSCAPKKSPTNLKEEKLQKIWAEILRLEPSMIGVDESFFRLGGNSIAAMKVSAAARQIGWNLPVSEIFRSLNIATLSARLPDLPI